MEILYKYTSLFPLEYFNEPTIKIASIEYLNDPFEFNTSENILYSIEKYCEKINLSADEIAKWKDDCIAEINLLIAYNGIVSFSETPRNSLMWAHYANHHSGMCIGYKKDLLEHINTDDITNGDGKYLLPIVTPKKINYDNLRFETDYDFSAPMDEISIEATTNHLFKKSDEWMYEKEHRCIVPFCKAEILQVINENAILNRKFQPTRRRKTRIKQGTSYKTLISYALTNDFIKKSETANKYYINTKDPVQCDLIKSSKDALMLVKIDPDAIHSIYFGCNVELEKIKPYYENLHDKYRIYKFELCKQRFELVPKLVTSDLFT